MEHLLFRHTFGVDCTAVVDVNSSSLVVINIFLFPWETEQVSMVAHYVNMQVI